MTDRTRRNAPETGSSFRQRLGTYLTGVAIGLVLLGVFQVARTREQAQRDGERRAQRDAQSESRSPVQPDDRADRQNEASNGARARSDGADGVSG